MSAHDWIGTIWIAFSAVKVLTRAIRAEKAKPSEVVGLVLAVSIPIGCLIAFLVTR